MNQGQPVIEVQNLQKIYRGGWLRRQKIQALQDVTLTIPRGRIYGLLGPNGAGKTTLIKILLGIVRKSAGRAAVLGYSAGHLQARRRIGYLPENHRIPRHLTGRTALEYYGCLSGLSAGEVRRRTPQLLAQVGLTGRDKERVGGYSKGMQQRLGLAQAMLHRPELIILDEPTDGVDPVGRKEIRDVLRELADGGTSVFLNSHLLQEIELICESVAILTQGRVRITGSVRELTEAMAESPLLLRVATDEATARECLQPHKPLSVQSVKEGEVEVQVVLSDQGDVDRMVDAFRETQISILSLRRRDLTLEEAFLQIIREEGA